MIARLSLLIDSIAIYNIRFWQPDAWWRCGRALDLRLTGCGFNSQPVRFHVTYNSALRPFGVAKSNTCFGWG